MPRELFAACSSPHFRVRNQFEVGRAWVGTAKGIRVVHHFRLGVLTLWAGINLALPASAADLPASQSVTVITNVSQFQTVAAQDFLRGCSFHLAGTVTLVDTNLDLLVI
jgi:hypothetical protein